MFLAWYANCEPPWLTGLPIHESYGDVFSEVFEMMGGVHSTDPEFLYVVALMSKLFPWACGDESKWVAQGQECQRKLKELGEPRFPAEQFVGRGTFGKYFAHMARLDEDDG
jgi:hypothetical protein